MLALSKKCNECVLSCMTQNIFLFALTDWKTDNSSQSKYCCTPNFCVFFRWFKTFFFFLMEQAIWLAFSVTSWFTAENAVITGHPGGVGFQRYWLCNRHIHGSSQGPCCLRCLISLLLFLFIHCCSFTLRSGACRMKPFIKSPILKHHLLVTPHSRCGWFQRECRMACGVRFL